MARISKRKQAIREQVDRTKVYAIDEAFELLKSTSKVKFTESVDVAIVSPCRPGWESRSGSLGYVFGEPGNRLPRRP